MMVEDDTSATEDVGENYFVSMTDMMVGVLFIFIIMLMTFALDFRRTTDVQEDALKVAQEVADRLSSLQAQVREEIDRLDRAGQDRRQMLFDIRDQLVAEGISVQVDEANGVLRLTEDTVRFQPNRADLEGRNRDNVGRIARVLDRVLPRYVPCRAGQEACGLDVKTALETMFVEGHTDITGRDDRNWQLSTERAVNTYREMIAVAPNLRALLNRNRQEAVSVSGYSSTRPIDAQNIPEAYARNRRIDLRFVMETDTKQGLQQILRMTDDMRGEIERLRKVTGATP